MTTSVRNRIGWRERLAIFQGSTVSLELEAFDEPLAAIAALEAEVTRLSDEEIAGRADACRQRIARGGEFAAERATIFALVREASRRTLGLRPFDVQVMAALAMD